jgi:hypothetical protein
MMELRSANLTETTFCKIALLVGSMAELEMMSLLPLWEIVISSVELPNCVCRFEFYAGLGEKNQSRHENDRILEREVSVS